MKDWKGIRGFWQAFKEEVRKDWVPPYDGVYFLISGAFILMAIWTSYNLLLFLFFMGCSGVVSWYRIRIQMKQREQEEKEEHKEEEQKEEKNE